MKRAIALGTFDGVHIGHRAIINAAIDKAAELDMEPMIYTFTAHPMALFGKQPPLLMTQSERMAALGGMGCALSADEFSAEYAATEPEQFIKMLIERLDMGCAVAGFNYTFGRRGDGSVELIKKLGEKVKVAELEGIPGASASRERGEGFHKLADSKLTVVAKQTAEFDRSKGLTVAENMLQANPDIKAIFAQNDEMALGAIEAAKSAGKQIFIVGFDGTADGVKAVESGAMSATIAQQPEIMGQQGLEVAVKAAKGEKVEAKISAPLKLIEKK